MVEKKFLAKCVRNKKAKIATQNENAEITEENDKKGGDAKEWACKAPNEGSNGRFADEVEWTKAENRNKSDRPDLEKAFDMIHDIPLSGVPAGDALRTRWLTHVSESENPAKEAERIVQMAVQLCQQTYPDAKAWTPKRMPMNFDQPPPGPKRMPMNFAKTDAHEFGSPPTSAGIKAGAILLQGLQPRPNRNGVRTSPQRTMKQVEADLWQGPPPPMHPAPAIGSSVVHDPTRSVRTQAHHMADIDKEFGCAGSQLTTSNSVHHMAGSIPIRFDSAPEPLCSSKKGKNKIGNWMQAKVGADEPTTRFSVTSSRTYYKGADDPADEPHQIGNWMQANILQGLVLQHCSSKKVGPPSRTSCPNSAAFLPSTKTSCPNSSAFLPPPPQPPTKHQFSHLFQ